MMLKFVKLGSKMKRINNRFNLYSIQVIRKILKLTSSSKIMF